MSNEIMALSMITDNDKNTIPKKLESSPADNNNSL